MAKRIPPAKIDEIYAAAQILDVVGEYVDLKRRGSNWFGLSPFVNERTPSFAVSPSKNIFKDFASGKGGNAITFLMEAEGMTYVEALSHVAKRYGIELDLEDSPEEEASRDVRDSLFILNEYAAGYFHEQLLNPEAGAVALAYFRERGILETTLQTFRLGYNPEGWDTFAKAAQKQQYKEEYLVSTGLCIKSEKDGRLIDRFRGRIMFPIWNHLGKVVGFGGRIMGKADGVAKYLNSPESEIYHKSRILFGLYQARQAIRDRDQCILVEGYMDMISLYQAGVQNVVASSGTALTEDQIRLIKRFTPNVLLVYDADRAGISAALRGADLLLENELNVRVLLLPEGDDPDSYVKQHGKSGWDTYVQTQAADFLDFKADHLRRTLDPADPQTRVQLVHEIAETLARIPDEVKRALYTERAAERLQVAPGILQKAVDQALEARQRQQQRNDRFQELRNKNQGTVTAPPPEAETGITVAPDTPAAVPDAQEREILRLLINYSDRVVSFHGADYPLPQVIQAGMGELTFDNPNLEEFRRELYQQIQSQGAVNIHPLLTHANLEIAATATRLLTIPMEVSPNWGKFMIQVEGLDTHLERSVESALMHFQFKKIKGLLRENQERIKACTDNTQLDELLRNQIRLDQLRKTLSESLGITIHD